MHDTRQLIHCRQYGNFGAPVAYSCVACGAPVFTGEQKERLRHYQTDGELFPEPDRYVVRHGR